MRSHTIPSGLMLVLASILASVTVASGCNKPGDPGKAATDKPASGEAAKTEPAPAAPGDSILVGEYGSLTGSEATFGQSTHNGVLLAIKEVNGAGGVKDGKFKGKKLAVKVYDDAGKPQEAGNAVTRLITDDKVVAVIGEVASSLSIAGGRVAQQYKVPMITPSSTNPQVTAIGDMVFRVCFLDPFQGWVEAKFATDNLKAKTAALLFDQAQAYSKGLKEFFKKSFTEMGGTIATEQAFSGGDQDFSAQLTTIRDLKPDVILIPGYYTDVANIAVQARKLGITAPFLGGDGWDSSQLYAIGGAAIDGSYFSNHYAPSEERPEVQNFVKNYKTEYGGTPDGLAALAYDATLLLADSISRAEGLDGPTLAKSIAATKDFHGVTGIFSIDEHRDAKKSAVVVQAKDGKPLFVTSISPPSS